MGEKRQSVLFYVLSLALALFMMGHSLVVQVEFEACFGNLAASLNGDRPYLRVAEMSLGRLASLAGQSISADHLVIAALGLLPLLPFRIAWAASGDRLSRHLWTASAIAAFLVIVGWTVTSELTDFYDCDLNGVSLAILFAPILYTAATSAATLVVAGLRSVALSAMGRE